jgi:hypothetical protein
MELFERFKKGNPGGDSIGIGLAIVRQICDLSHFTVGYQYRSGAHSVAVGFGPRTAASKSFAPFTRRIAAITSQRGAAPGCGKARTTDFQKKQKQQFYYVKNVTSLSALGPALGFVARAVRRPGGCPGTDAEAGCTDRPEQLWYYPRQIGLCQSRPCECQGSKE